MTVEASEAVGDDEGFEGALAAVEQARAEAEELLEAACLPMVTERTVVTTDGVEEAIRIETTLADILPDAVSALVEGEKDLGDVVAAWMGRGALLHEFTVESVAAAAEGRISEAEVEDFMAALNEAEDDDQAETFMRGVVDLLRAA